MRRQAGSTCWSPAPAMSGLAAAVSIRAARPSLRVAVVDAAPAGAWERDGRASAIAAAGCRMLEQLGCWAEIAPHAQAITEMIVTDSRTADPLRPVFLTFDGEVAPGEPFAHMVITGRSTARCGAARQSSASTSSRASRSSRSRSSPARRRSILPTE